MKTRIKIICGNWKERKDVVYVAQKRVLFFLWTDSFDYQCGEVISFRSTDKEKVLDFIDDMKNWKDKVNM